MIGPAGKVLTENFSFSSCVRSDVWHPEKDRRGYEWWYFDALSDDGREAVVIIFLDNFIFSPGYNALIHRNRLNGHDAKFPAVAFVYYRDGKPVYRAINEFGPEDFEAGTDTPRCRIGESLFHFESAPYGSGYVLEISANLSKNRRVRAKLEWLSIECDLLPAERESPSRCHHWNLVSPRSDVTGRITVTDRRGAERDAIHFRGTGYHDHNYDGRWLPETVRDWQWGRSHYPDATAVFYRYREIGSGGGDVSRLFLVRDNELTGEEAEFTVQETGRDKFGLKYPKRIKIETADDVRLRVKQTSIVDSSFFYLRFLSEMTLTMRDGKPRKTYGITEHLEPKALKYRWLDWLVNMRIGKHGKSPFLS